MCAVDLRSLGLSLPIAWLRRNRTARRYGDSRETIATLRRPQGEPQGRRRIRYGVILMIRALGTSVLLAVIMLTTATPSLQKDWGDDGWDDDWDDWDDDWDDWRF
ncbi:hypothetical protein Amac_062570 [Acrocarpospora macrocephala]|uniref:Uncharacterized protein n=1 Tax=Acrocarpospora macrocephala TaxID=150177 RepID=A0A5M3WVC4_9ACTN|nr:hypothetical protein Amac_062570 [Acrocarpospora macrocephala]